jgi:hypothetical protein
MKIEHELSTKSLKDLEFDLETSINPIFFFVIQTRQKPLKPSKEKAKANAKVWLARQKTKP